MAGLLLPKLEEICHFLTSEDVKASALKTKVARCDPTKEALCIVYWEDRQFGPVKLSAINCKAHELTYQKKITARYTNGQSYEAIYICSIEDDEEAAYCLASELAERTRQKVLANGGKGQRRKSTKRNLEFDYDAESGEQDAERTSDLPLNSNEESNKVETKKKKVAPKKTPGNHVISSTVEQSVPKEKKKELKEKQARNKEAQAKSSQVAAVKFFENNTVQPLSKASSERVSTTDATTEEGSMPSTSAESELNNNASSTPRRPVVDHPCYSTANNQPIWNMPNTMTYNSPSFPSHPYNGPPGMPSFMPPEHYPQPSYSYWHNPAPYFPSQTPAPKPKPVNCVLSPRIDPVQISDEETTPGNFHRLLAEGTASDGVNDCTATTNIIKDSLTLLQGPVPVCQSCVEKDHCIEALEEKVREMKRKIRDLQDQVEVVQQNSNTQSDSDTMRKKRYIPQTRTPLDFANYDYFNFVTDPNRVYLPPLQPKYAFSDHADGRLPNSSYQDLSKASLPKTFITRKGALLLFSEDFAAKSFGRDDDEHGPLKHPMGNLDLKTFGDLAKSILSYGSHGDGDKVHLRFVHDRLAMPRKIRPGFSARRYLSRLTRSFDDSFLDTLTSRGYIQEKTLYQTNSLVPNLRRRINDDLSYLPAPYRIMKSMLVAPGFLSGYNFQRLGTQDSEELSVVLEEEETDSVGHPVHSLGGLQLVEHHGDGATHTVSYSGLNHSEKENVLADLLVKSAINHALEKQKQKLLGDSGSSLSGSVKDLGAERALLSARSTDSETGREQLEFNMAEAVRSYLESQMDDQSVVLDAQTVGSGKKSRSNSQQDSKSSRISVKSVGGSPRGSFQGFPSSTSASIKDSWSAGSHRSTSNAITGGITIPSGRLPLSPITDLDSREPTLNKTPVLPPITTPGTEHDHGTDPHIPKVNVQPPTPQMTSLSLTNKPGLSREPTVQAIPETSGPEDEDENASEEEKEEDSTGWGTTVDEAAILRESEAELEKKAQLEQEETDQQKSQQSLLGHENARRGPVLAGGSHLQSSQDNLTSDIHNTSLTSVQSHPALKGSPLRATGSVKSPSRPNSACSSQSTKDKEKGAKGSVIIGPRGEQIFVGGAVTKDPELVSLQSDSQSVFSEGVRNEEEETTWPLDLSKDTPSERVSPVGYGRKKDFDASSGDFDATLSMTVKRLTSQSDVVEDSPRSTMSGGGDRLTGRASATEQELVQTLTEHAHKIASQVLNQPTTGLDLGTDAKVAAKLWTSTTPANQLSRSQSLQHLSEEAEAVRLLRERSFSAEPSVAEYRQLLKERIGSAVLTTSGEAIPEDAQISDELVVALSQQQLSPADIEVVKDEDGSTVIRPRSSQPSPGDHNSAEMPRAADIKVVKDEDGGTVIRPHSSEPSPGDHDSAELPRGGASDGRQLPSGAGQMTSGPGFDIINYGEAEHQTEEKSELVVRLPEVGEAHPGGDGRKSTVSEKSSQVLSQVSLAVEENVSKENSSKNDKNRQADSSKTNKSLANRSKSSIEDREEFVVGKVEDKKELERLYGPSEKTPPTKEAKEKKPGVSPGKKVKNVKGKKGKKTKKETKVKEAPPSPVKLLTPAPVQGLDGKSSRSSSGKSDSHKSKEESEMSFIIIRDVESSPEPEAKSETKSIRPKLPSSAGTNKIESEDESYIEETELSSFDEEDEDLASISNKDARAAKRAAQAAKKREAVERKRREHDELLKKKREEAERREQMERELDEEKRRKDEERRLQKLKAEEEQKEKETAEAERKRLAQIEAERERRQREEYARRLEDMRKKQAEEDRLRREREEQERAEEAARKKAEEELLASMAEEERQEYLRRKEQEEENRRLREEQERIYREEQARKAMEEAQQLAEEMARKKAEFERRLAFNRGLQLEASGMDHTQDITRAFVFSYFELLQWLMGGEIPPIERMKGGHL